MNELKKLKLQIAIEKAEQLIKNLREYPETYTINDLNIIIKELDKFYFR